MITEKVNADLPLIEMLHNTLTRTHQVDLSERPLSLKLIANELWSCQGDGITVYDEQLNILRTLKGQADRPVVWNVAITADDVVVVTGLLQSHLSTKSGWSYYILS